MHQKYILCSDCGKMYRLRERVFRCSRCGGSLEVVFDYTKFKGLTWKRFRSRPFNHARYRELYPVKELVSIQEGGTPLVRSANVEGKKKLPFKVWFKFEAQNPTGSFKDRGSSVEVARALEAGARRVMCASTGNMGASVAAYSGIANLPCTIFTPKDTVQVKMEQILAYGARVYHINGDYSTAARMVEAACKKYGFYLLGDYLWRREGTKSVGYEIADQMLLSGGEPDYIVCPIGNGTLISAVWKAFKELHHLKLVRKLPRMVGVQARTCPPVYEAFRGKGEIVPKCGKTVAVAIECGDPLDGKRALLAMEESRGSCVTVSDQEILRARELLAEEEGLFAEPAGAVALAGLLKAGIKRNSRVACLVTGHGLKAPRTGVKGKPEEIAGKLSVLDKLFKPIRK